MKAEKIDERKKDGISEEQEGSRKRKKRKQKINEEKYFVRLPQVYPIMLPGQESQQDSY